MIRRGPTPLVWPLAVLAVACGTSARSGDRVDPATLPIAAAFQERLATAIATYDAAVAREVERLAADLASQATTAAGAGDAALAARLRDAERLLREEGEPPPSSLAREERAAGQARINRAGQALAASFDAVAKDLRTVGEEAAALQVQEARTAALLSTSLWTPVGFREPAPAASPPPDDGPDLPTFDRFDPDRTVVNSIGQSFALVPVGTSGPAGEPTAVRIERPFWIARTEVTQKQWREVMKTEPWHNLPYMKVGDDHAASYLSWNLAAVFCRTLTERERKGGLISADVAYRLPTEAEWEHACRAGTTTRYSFGDDLERLGDHAWWGGAWVRETQSFMAGSGPGNAAADFWPHEVGRLTANPWGLFDMHGNVWEPCSDLFEPADPQAPPRPAAPRVLRGGSWPDPEFACESGFRGNTDPTRRVYNIGLRVVRTVVPADLR